MTDTAFVILTDFYTVCNRHV